jgi:signal transduction histidine kinase
VCRTLVEQAGGTVAIESRDGGGIVATVRLPGQ